MVGEDEWFDLVSLMPTLPGVGAQVATGMAMLQRQGEAIQAWSMSQQNGIRGANAPLCQPLTQHIL